MLFRPHDGPHAHARRLLPLSGRRPQLFKGADSLGRELRGGQTAGVVGLVLQGQGGARLHHRGHRAALHALSCARRHLLPAAPRYRRLRGPGHGQRHHYGGFGRQGIYREAHLRLRGVQGAGAQVHARAGGRDCLGAGRHRAPDRAPLRHAEAGHAGSGARRQPGGRRHLERWVAHVARHHLSYWPYRQRGHEGRRFFHGSLGGNRRRAVVPLADVHHKRHRGVRAGHRAHAGVGRQRLGPRRPPVQTRTVRHARVHHHAQHRLVLRRSGHGGRGPEET